MNKSNQYNFLIHTLTKTMRQLDIDCEAVFKAAKVDLSVLERTPTIVSEHQLTDLCLEILSRTDTPELGLILGQHTNTFDHSAVGYLGLTSETLGQAISSILRFRGLISNLTKLEVAYTDSEFILRTHCTQSNNRLRKLYLEWELVADLYTAETLCRQKIVPSGIYVDSAKPEYAHLYQDIFKCPVYFDQPYCEFRLELELLSTPLPSYDPVVKAAMEDACKKLSLPMSGKRNIIDEVKSLIIEQPGAFPKQEYVAEKLNISPRTLHRRLQESNSSYQALLDETRANLAKHYLGNSDLQVQRISELCGFIDAQNFSIAFKRWTGHSPSSYRTDRH